MAEQLNLTMPFEPEGGGPLGSVNVAVEVDAGAIISISGIINGNSYQGSIHFTSLDGGPCLVCGPPPMQCHWENPCPGDG